MSMTTIGEHDALSAARQRDRAAALLGGLAEQDFTRVGGAFTADAKQRLGAGWFTVEQQAYGDTASDGRIARLDLLCTGYLPGDDHV